MIYVVQFDRFFIRTVLAVALIFACLRSSIAQAQDLTAHESSAAENNSATEASKQAANPLASVWLMQFQQNNTWLGMPANSGNRVQSNLQFQPLMSVKLTDDWSLVTRPVLQVFNTTPFQDEGGQANRMTAFGDAALALALSPGHRLVGNWLLAAGPTFIFPTRCCARVRGQELRHLCVSSAVVFGRGRRPKDPTNEPDLRFCPHLPERMDRWNKSQYVG
jgi:hypothetical protein